MIPCITNSAIERFQLVSKRNLLTKLMLILVRNGGLEPPPHGDISSDQWVASDGAHDRRNGFRLKRSGAVGGEKDMSRIVVVGRDIQKRAIQMTPYGVKIRFDENLRPLPNHPSVLNTSAVFGSVVGGIVKASVSGGIGTGRHRNNQRRINSADLPA